MLPLSLLRTAQNHPMLVELKNGETYNGHLVSCDNWMNINLREVICTSRDGDRFWRMSECYVRGSTIKYLRIPDEVSPETFGGQSNYQTILLKYIGFVTCHVFVSYCLHFRSLIWSKKMSRRRQVVEAVVEEAAGVRAEEDREAVVEGAAHAEVEGGDPGVEEEEVINLSNVILQQVILK